MLWERNKNVQGRKYVKWPKAEHWCLMDLAMALTFSQNEFIDFTMMNEYSISTLKVVSDRKFNIIFILNFDELKIKRS